MRYDRQFSTFAALKPGEIDWGAVLDDAAWPHMPGITAPPRSASLAIEAARVHLSFHGKDQAPGKLVERSARSAYPIVGEADLLLGRRDIRRRRLPSLRKRIPDHAKHPCRRERPSIGYGRWMRVSGTGR